MHAISAFFPLPLWACPAGSRTRATDDDLELDRDFLQHVHDLKLKLIDKAWVERSHKAVMKGQAASRTTHASTQ